MLWMIDHFWLVCQAWVYHNRDISQTIGGRGVLIVVNLPSAWHEDEGSVGSLPGLSLSQDQALSRRNASITSATMAAPRRFR